MSGVPEELMATNPRGADGKKYVSDIVRNHTEIEKQVLAHHAEAHKAIESLPATDASSAISLFMPKQLGGVVFVGHLVTDLDSVAGAIGAAAFHGGTPALASDINTETAFALEKFGAVLPPRIEDVLKANPDAKICLVDHQQTSQMNPAIRVEQIVGVIDHHALQSKTIVTDKPIYIDIRPWGSMSSIVAHSFLTNNRRPTKAVAGMLLCAILSDTLNLRGPTTTKWDQFFVAVLAEIAEIEDIQLLASQQFKAKSRELATLSAHGLVNGDLKSFGFETPDFKGDVGFAVIETTDDAVIMSRLSEMLPELVACKKEKGYQALFLAVVNIVSLESNLILCGPTERALGFDSFGGTLKAGGEVLPLGGLVSRKQDFVPAITKAIKGGWKKPSGMKRGPSSASLSSFGSLEVNPEDPFGRATRNV